LLNECSRSIHASWGDSRWGKYVPNHGVLTMPAPTWLALAGWSNNDKGLQSAYWYCNKIIIFLSVLYSQFICVLLGQGIKPEADGLCWDNFSDTRECFGIST
jgi:hypothetical protein